MGDKFCQRLGALILSYSKLKTDSFNNFVLNIFIRDLTMLF